MRLANEPDVVELVGEDDGRGTPVTDRDRVFDRFTQLDEARTKGGTGSGLGLAIANDSMVRHGGSIEVDEDAVTGKRTSVHLPSRRARTEVG